MGRFRNYKDYTNDTDNNNLDVWENSYSNSMVNSLPNKTIIRTITNYLKYGSLSRKVYI